MNIPLLIALIVCICIIIALTYGCLNLYRKKEALKEKVIELAQENKGLAEHNGKLFDTNADLKAVIESRSVPDFNKW